MRLAAEVPPEPVVIVAPSENSEAREVVREILRATEDGTPLHRVAILVRNPDQQEPAIVAELSLRKIPFFRPAGTGFATSPIGRAARLLFALAAEGFPVEAFREHFQKHFSTDTILILRFGTTETGTLRRIFFTVNSCVDAAAVPVGYATEDTDIKLLDEDGKDVQFGAVGEIVVESRYVSPGYWRQPDLTREKFFSDPNGGDKLIFHTGDLGRLRSDGLLYHLGRKDFQLNIRGYRVEAGEIEAVLLAQDNVKEGVVATGKTSTGADSIHLIAYIVPFSMPLPSIPVLRRAVGTKLPAHMIPSDFVFLESLPLTPNGNQKF